MLGFTAMKLNPKSLNPKSLDPKLNPKLQMLGFTEMKPEDCTPEEEFRDGKCIDKAIADADAQARGAPAPLPLPMSPAPYSRHPRCG